MIKFIFFLLVIISLLAPSYAHDGKATYIANEGVMVTHPGRDEGEIKILFDPLPLSGFGTYMDTPEDVKAAMLSGAAPYDNVNAVFISHAHRDHFSAANMIAFMKAQPQTHLAAPAQARDMMMSDPAWEPALEARMTILDMDYGDAPQSFEIGSVKASAVRIAHAGWPAPRRVIVQNMIFRVTLGDGPTVMHMGDADPRAQHYAPFDSHWQAQLTDLGLPPYWFLTAPGGPQILKNINVVKSVGTHVPLQVPEDLKNSGADYFSISGESRVIPHAATEGCAPLRYSNKKYTVCEFSAASDIRTFWGKDGKPFKEFSALKTHLESQGQTLRFAMNGGMYEKDRSAVGLFTEEWKTKSGLVTKDMTGNFGLKPNGVFWMWQEDGFQGFHVRSTDIYSKAAHDVVRFATQSGPMLVIDGALHPKFRAPSTSLNIRNGVGVSADSSRVYFVMSEEPVNFHSFASLFKDHLKTPNALYLDGTVSRLFDAEARRHDKGHAMGPMVGVVGGARD